MSRSWANVANALQTKLIADATLVSLVQHSSANPAIGTSFPEAKSPKRLLAFQLFNARPITGNVTQIKVMRIDILAFCVKKVQSIDIIDRIEYLFDNPGASNADYYDFSDTNIKVFDSRTALRLPEFFYKDFDRFGEGLRITVRVDPYSTCP